MFTVLLTEKNVTFGVRAKLDFATLRDLFLVILFVYLEENLLQGRNRDTITLNVNLRHVIIELREESLKMLGLFIVNLERDLLADL